MRRRAGASHGRQAGRELRLSLAWLVVLAGGAFAARGAAVIPGAVEAVYAGALFPRIAGLVGAPARAVSVSLVQLIAVVLVAGVGSGLILGTRRAIRRRSWTAGFGPPHRPILLLALITWGFQLAWGFNYARPPLAERLKLRSVPAEPANLTRLVRTLAHEVNASYRLAVASGQYGSPQTPAISLEPATSLEPITPLEPTTPLDPAAAQASLLAAAAPDPGRPNQADQRSGSSDPVTLRIDRQVVADRLAAGFEWLVPSFQMRPLPTPKHPRPLGWVLTRLGLSGFYFPFTAEATVNAAIPDAAVPFIAAHEMAHQRGIAPEDEANFQAYLACRESGLAAAGYSGALGAFGLAFNALARAAPDSVRVLTPGLLDAGPRADRQAIRDFWTRHEGPASAAAERVNHAYLRANAQGGGIASYGRAVDLLLAYQAAGLLEADD